MRLWATRCNEAQAISSMWATRKTLFPPHETLDIAERKLIKWQSFVGAMPDAGFSVQARGGSGFNFTGEVRNNDIKKYGASNNTDDKHVEKKSIIFHCPNSDPEISAVV